MQRCSRIKGISKHPQASNSWKPLQPPTLGEQKKGAVWDTVRAVAIEKGARDRSCVFGRGRQGGGEGSGSRGANGSLLFAIRAT